MDQFKGMLIFLVVLGHLVQELSAETTHHPFFNWIYAFHMPCFMFVTGYLAYLTFHGENFRQLISGIGNKVTTILVPYYTWLIFVYGPSFSGKWNLEIWDKLWNMTVGWSGLWFLKYVFIYYVIYAIALELRNQTRARTGFVADCVIFLSGLATGLFLRKIVGGLDSYILYGIFFFIGIIFSKHECLKVWAANRFSVLLCAALFFVFVGKYDFHDRTLQNDFVKLVVSFSAICVFYNGYAASQTKSILQRTLARYGKGTLAIYVSHFLFLRMITDDLPAINALFFGIIVVALSFMVIEVCLWINGLCSVSVYLRFLLYGGKISSLFGTDALQKELSRPRNDVIS
jgi:fucose 4-O-acetylase-like acetyltransferase